MIASRAVGTRNPNNIKIIDSLDGSGIRVETLEYVKLMGGVDSRLASHLWYMEHTGIRARQVSIELQNNGVKIEPGAMSYFRGNIDMVSGLTMGNAVGRFLGGAITGEKAAQPEYKGTGQVVLEPSFKHFLLSKLDQGEQVIVDKGMFYGAESSVDVRPIMNSNISSALLGGEGIFQISLTGPGIVILESLVPMDEIDIIELNNESLKVDGNFAILRHGGIQFTVERSARTLMGSAMSGEGLVNVFRGTGQVWLAPTIKVYDAMKLAAYYGTSTSSVNMNTSSSRPR